MQPLQLIQATLIRSDERVERVAYLVQINFSAFKRASGLTDDELAVSGAIDSACAALSRAFAERVLNWEAPITIAAEIPAYDPIFEQEGVRAWIIPVEVEDGAYLFLVG